MKSLDRNVWTRCVSALGGVLLAVASIWLLGLLNARAMVEVPPRERAPSVLIRGPESAERLNEPAPEEPEPDPPEPEIMEVDLDLPQPEEITPEPLELETPLPTPSQTRVVVNQKRAPPAPRPEPPKQPAKPQVQSASEVDQRPQESSSNPPPTYPPTKLRSRIEGTVVLRLLIGKSGHIEDVRVVSGDSEFVQAVMQVVWRWRFTPARDAGEPVKVWAIKRVNFTLRR